jgi:HK97 gp10 family phage protein
MRVDGDKRLIAKLQTMTAGRQRRVMRPALNAAAKPIVGSARSNAARDSGLMAKSIGHVTRTGKKGNIYTYVGPRTGFERFVMRDGFIVFSNPVKYAHLVEFGTAAHGISGSDFMFTPAGPRRSVQHPGAVSKPFLRPAFDANTSTSIRIAHERMWQELTKIARKK